jgi:REP element-mobilizing transposase RayT
MIHQFGEVEKGKMILNDFGRILDNLWNWLPEQYGYCRIDEYVIMPNHFHGILIIDPTDVVTSRDLSLQKEEIKIKPLSELIGVFKTKSSKEIHLKGNKSFKWQRSFYDRIIRNEKELYNIQKYIKQNPLKWEIEKNIESLDL